MDHYVAIPFFLFVVTFLGLFIYFRGVVAPKALALWADEQSLKILRRTEAGPFKRMAARPSNVQVVYRVIVIDKTGSTCSGLVKVGHYARPALSPDHCPIEAYWDEAPGPDFWDNLWHDL